MSQVIVNCTAAGWAIHDGDILLEASNPIHDRGIIRCLLSARKAGQLVDRNPVNITGERSRNRFVAKVHTKGVTIPEAWLLAMDEAIRTTPRPTSNGHNKDMCDGGASFSCKPLPIADLKEQIEKWLLLKDSDILNILLGAVVAHRLGGESPWLLLVAPPSGTKTELLRMLWTSPGIYPLSELTPRTFASGLDKPGEDPSLLARLKDEILVLKDLTTILEMRQEDRQGVLAQLREIYDGRFDKAWGTGKELHWEGRLGFLAGVTPVIDKHYSVMGLLGPRFLLRRQEELEAQGREDVANRAMDNAQHDVQMRAELAAATAQFLAGIPNTPPAIPVGAKHWLAKVANLVTFARSPVNRDGYRKELEYAPEAEIPARLARQLYALLQGVTLVAGRETPTADDLKQVGVVAWDCIPVMRQRMLENLRDSDDALSTSELATAARIPTTTARYALEDIQALGLVEREKANAGGADRWRLLDVHRAAMLTLQNPPADVDTLHEKYVPPSYKNGDPCAVCGDDRSGDNNYVGTEGDPLCCSCYAAQAGLWAEVPN